MAIEPDNADVRYALGRYLVRKHDYPEALDLLRRAHELMPDYARYAYIYAVALNSSGAARESLALLEEAHQQHPADRSVLMALVSIGRGFTCGIPPCPRAADPRSRQRAAAGSGRRA
jgi:tetratricopeptide (TPR) repeat protein